MIAPPASLALLPLPRNVVSDAAALLCRCQEIPRNFTFRFVFFAFLAFYLSFLAYLVISPSRLRHLQRMYGSAEISSPVAGTRFRNKFLAGDGLAEPSTSASTTEPLLQNSSQE